MIWRTFPPSTSMSLHGARWQAGTFDNGASSMVPPVYGAMISRRKGHRVHTRKGDFDKVHDEDAVENAQRKDAHHESSSYDVKLPRPSVARRRRALVQLWKPFRLTTVQDMGC